MKSLPKSVQNAITEFSRLPGIGPKSAQRLAFHLLRQDKKVSAQLGEVCNGSGWGSERVSCGVFYDLSKGRRHHALMPVISLTVDIPVSWFATERSMRTFGVSLAVESYF